MKKYFKLSSSFMALALFLVHGESFGGVRTLTIRNLDLDRGVDGCNEYLSQAVEQFQQDSGVTVISFGCEADSISDVVGGSIVYSADEPVPVWSTTSTTFGDQYPFYTSRDQCEEALGREVEIVRDLTGLNPFLAFCHKISLIGAPRYRTRIDAVGVAQAWRYEDVASLRHSLVDVGAVVETLHQQARDYGLAPVAWYHGSIRSSRGLAVAFYHNVDRFQRSYLHGKPLQYVSTLEECERARSVFEQTRTTEWTGATGCSAAHPTVGFQLNAFWWDNRIGSAHGLKSTVLPNGYATLDDCWNASAAISAQLGQAGEEIIGISCGRDHSIRSALKMVILSKLNRG